MTDLSKARITTLLDRLDEMERKITDLERSNALVGAIPQGYSIQVLDPADGSIVAVIGATDSGAGAEFRDSSGVIVARLGDISGGARGVEIGNNPTGLTTNTFFSATPAGVEYPYQVHPWYNFQSGSVPTTSGTFFGAHRCRIELATATKVKVRTTCSADAATTGEFRLYEQATGRATTAIAIPANSFVDYVFGWDLSPDVIIGTGPIQLELQVRRTSGAGNVWGYIPSELIMSTAISPATSTGV